MARQILVAQLYTLLLEDAEFQAACPLTDEMLSVPKACYFTNASSVLAGLMYADDAAAFGYSPPEIDEDMTAACAAFDF